jgi:hypothetical protein
MVTSIAMGVYFLGFALCLYQSVVDRYTARALRSPFAEPLMVVINGFCASLCLMVAAITAFHHSGDLASVTFLWLMVINPFCLLDIGLALLWAKERQQ